MKHILVALTVTSLSFSGCKQESGSRARSSTRPKLPVPLSLTADQLRKIADDQLESVIIAAMDNSMAGKYEWQSEILRAWSPGLRMLYTTWWVEAEVNNGGFNQYFWNTEGKQADMALEGFRLVNARRYADILKRAIAIEKEEAARMQKYKDEGTLDAFSKSYEHTKLNDLDSAFYDLDEDLSALRVKYIRSHLSEFTTK